MRQASWWTGLLLTGCAHSTPPPPTTSAPEENIEVHAAFSCETGEQLATDYDADAGRITLSMGDNVTRLDRVSAGGPGYKFSDGETTFWTHEEDATLKLGETSTELRCHRILER